MSNDSAFDLEISKSISNIVARGTSIAPRGDWNQVITKSQVVVPLKKERPLYLKNYKYISVAASITIVMLLSIALITTLRTSSPNSVQTTTDKEKANKSAVTTQQSLPPDSSSPPLITQDSANSITSKPGSDNKSSTTTTPSGSTQTTTPGSVQDYLVSAECGVTTSSATYAFGSTSFFVASYNKETASISITKNTPVLRVERSGTTDSVTTQIENAPIGQNITYNPEGAPVALYFASTADPSGEVLYYVGKVDGEEKLIVAPMNGDGSNNFNFVGYSWKSPKSGAVHVTTFDYAPMRYYGTNSPSGGLFVLDKNLVNPDPDSNIWGDLGHGFSGSYRVITSSLQSTGYARLGAFDDRNVGCILTTDYR